MSESSGRSYDPAKDAQAQEPLTDNELKLVTRLFSDPFAFPLEYKAWLRGWLEEQYPRIGTLAVGAATGAAGGFVPPAGAVLLWSSDNAPAGYVLCNGAEYDRTAPTYHTLYNEIGFRFGGVGSTPDMFKVPNAVEAFLLIKGTSAGMNTIGQFGGEKNHTLSVGEMPSHGHPTGGGNEGFNPGGSGGLQPTTGGDRSTGIVSVGSSGGGGSHNNMPPFLVLNAIISLGT